jgi:hypothetical protein
MEEPALETALVKANDEALRIMKIFEEATQIYSKYARKHVYPGEITYGKPIPQPEALLNINAFKDMEDYWQKIVMIEGVLHKTFIQLSLAQDAYFLRSKKADK